ncbi:aldehyde dehydrogenase family protein [Saccharopolyspora sp. CA-218241]|uniref:aldehyde dehydrogenase family protein n=1 Tax=Saccharopolyspora sp. CA-218241 TaxID=3240027 RepID=UPI003D98AD2C
MSGGLVEATSWDEDREVVEVRSPLDGELIDSIVGSGRHEVAAAVAAAHRAQAEWARVPAGERGAVLARLADAVRDAADELATTEHRETGRPREQARAAVEAAAGTLDEYAALGPVHRGRSLNGDHDATDLMVHEPRGVVAALTPWNEPVAVACGVLGAALVTGNAVVHKPSERAVRTGVLLNRVLAAHLPEGLLGSVAGGPRCGAELVADSTLDVIAHVGSTAAGRSIAAAAAATGAKTLLENGGNDALIVDAGIDPEHAAEQAAVGAFANSGQICTSVERIYVHRDLAEDFLAALVEQARRRVFGSPAADEIPMGPLVAEEHRAEVHRKVRDALDAGATLLAGGVLPDGDGSYYPATVLTDCRPEMEVLREEVLGPVAAVRVVDDFDQALREAAADRHGLAATVLTPDMAHAQRSWRALRVGTVKINEVFGGAPGGAAQPRGASGSGFGFGPELLDEMTATKVVHLVPPVLPGT